MHRGRGARRGKEGKRKGRNVELMASRRLLALVAQSYTYTPQEEERAKIEDI
jgi:hypothetical protein